MRTFSLVVICYGLLAAIASTSSAVEVPASFTGSDATGSDAGAPGKSDPAAARAIARRGLALMKQADREPKRMVDAAIDFAQACRLFQDAGDVDAVCEMQADMFWCRKRMDVDALQDFGTRTRKAGLGAVDALFAREVPLDEAQQWYDRAQHFADAHPGDDLEVAIRWFEVAERFQGSKVSLAAQRLSLEAQQRHVAPVASSAPSGSPSTLAENDPAVALDLAAPVVPARLAPPAPATVKAAAADLRKVMKDAYAAGGKPGKRALAEALVARADAAGDDDALRYTLLDEARDAAMSALEPCIGLIATKKLSDAYEVDGDALVKEMLSRCSSEAAAAAYGVLMTKPDDAKALTTVGKYEALTLGRWDAALPRLARCDDAAWVKAAAAEIAPPTTSPAQAAVAANWYELYRKASGSARQVLAAHAQAWFRRAIPGLTDTALDLAKLHSQELADELPVDPADYDHLSQRQWDHVDGMVVTVTAGTDRFDSGIAIPANVKVIMIPAPKDEWLVEPYRKDNVPCGPEGAKSMPRGKFFLGQILCGLDPARQQALGTLTGPGHLYFFPLIPVRGIIDGSIRIKVVQLPDPAPAPKP